MCRGSYTVEAALLIPLLILLMTGGIRVAIELYQEIKTEEALEDLTEFWAVDDFYFQQGIMEVIDDGS